MVRCGSRGGCHAGIIAEPDFILLDGEAVNFVELEWMTPGFEIGIDWRNRTPEDICHTVKEHLPTARAMRRHFFEDARIAWAVHSGKRPGVGYLEIAPPYDFGAFQDLMNAWIDAGAPCP